MTDRGESDPSATKPATERATRSLDGDVCVTRHGVQVVVVGGPDRGAQKKLAAGRWIVGAGPNADLRLSDEAVSRQHLEIEVGEGLVVRDLSSKNGSFYLGARFDRMRVDMSSVIVVGASALMLLDPDEPQLPQAPCALSRNRCCRSRPRQARNVL